jgi:hypothetical protein
MSRSKKIEAEPVEVVEVQPEAQTAAGEESPAAKMQQEIIPPVAYLGPTIKGIAVEGTVYASGIPAGLSAKADKIPALKGLIVGIDKMAASGVAIRTKGTALNTLYLTAKAKI